MKMKKTIVEETAAPAVTDGKDAVALSLEQEVVEAKKNGTLFPRILDTNNIKLGITSTLESMIRFMCSKSPNLEWSGFVFYKINKMPDSFNKVELTAFDMLVMASGTSSYTNFDYSADLIKYMRDKEYLGKSIYYGLIHSHHNMRPIPSETDFSTMEKEGLSRTHFLSLIVSNRDGYNAYFTRKVIVEKKESACYTYDSFDKKAIVYTDKSYSKYNAVEIYKVGTISFIFPNMKELNDRFDEILKRDKEEKAKLQKPSGPKRNKPGKESGTYQPDNEIRFPDNESTCFHKLFGTKLYFLIMDAMATLGIDGKYSDVSILTPKESKELLRIAYVNVTANHIPMNDLIDMRDNANDASVYLESEAGGEPQGILEWMPAFIEDLISILPEDYGY